MTAKLVTQWTDPRPRNSTVRYRLVKDDSWYTIDRCEKDSLGADRWVAIKAFTHVGNEAEPILLLTHAIEKLSKQLDEQAIGRPLSPQNDDVNPMSFIGYGRGDDQ